MRDRSVESLYGHKDQADVKVFTASESFGTKAQQQTDIEKTESTSVGRNDIAHRLDGSR